MMKSTILRMALGGAALLLALAASGPTQAQTVLSYSPWAPPGYVVNQAIFPWMEKVAEVTEGRVVIEQRAAAVGTPREQADVVRDGLADLSLVVTGYNPGRYPLLEIAELPLLSDNARELAPAISVIYEKYLDALKPFEGVQVLSAFTVATGQLVTIKNPVNSLNDLMGLKIYTANLPTSAVLGSLGVTPVSASIAETFAMASGGMIDGSVMPFEPTISFGLAPYFRHFTVIEGGLGQSNLVLIVNDAKWNTIDEADRDAIMAISGAVLGGQVGAAVAVGEEEARAKLAAEGVQFGVLPTDVEEALRQQVEVTYGEWVAKAQKAGLGNAADVLGELRTSLGH